MRNFLISTFYYFIIQWYFVHGSFGTIPRTPPGWNYESPYDAQRNRSKISGAFSWPFGDVNMSHIIMNVDFNERWIANRLKWNYSLTSLTQTVGKLLIYWNMSLNTIKARSSWCQTMLDFHVFKSKWEYNVGEPFKVPLSWKWF